MYLKIKCGFSPLIHRSINLKKLDSRNPNAYNKIIKNFCTSFEGLLSRENLNTSNKAINHGKESYKIFLDHNAETSLTH